MRETINPGERVSLDVANPNGLDPNAPGVVVRMAFYCGKCGEEVAIDCPTTGGLIETTCVCGAAIRLRFRQV